MRKHRAGQLILGFRRRSDGACLIATGLLAGPFAAGCDAAAFLLFGRFAASAAEHRVRPRVLLDDNPTGGLDATIAALDSHANIEVRLYDPLVRHEARWTNYLTDVACVSRRMHNKSFTFNHRATIMSGRNVGNEYFAAGSGG